MCCNTSLWQLVSGQELAWGCHAMRSLHARSLLQEGGGGNAQVDVKLVLADIIANVSAADVAHCNPAAGEEPAAAAAPEDSLMDDDFIDTAPQPGDST